MRTIAETIGVCLILTGGAAMDSPSLLAPVFMLLAGMTLLTISYKGEH